MHIPEALAELGCDPSPDPGGATAALRAVLRGVAEDQRVRAPARGGRRRRGGRARRGHPGPARPGGASAMTGRGVAVGRAFDAAIERKYAGSKDNQNHARAAKRVALDTWGDRPLSSLTENDFIDLLMFMRRLPVPHGRESRQQPPRERPAASEQAARGGGGGRRGCRPPRGGRTSRHSGTGKTRVDPGGADAEAQHEDAGKAPRVHPGGLHRGEGPSRSRRSRHAGGFLDVQGARQGDGGDGGGGGAIAVAAAPAAALAPGRTNVSPRSSPARSIRGAGVPDGT